MYEQDSRHEIYHKSHEIRQLHLSGVDNEFNLNGNNRNLHNANGVFGMALLGAFSFFIPKHNKFVPKHLKTNFLSDKHGNNARTRKRKITKSLAKG
jgi:hypothetical protein